MIIHTERSFDIYLHVGRQQPYTIWRNGHTWYFTDSFDKAMGYIWRQSSRHRNCGQL